MPRWGMVIDLDKCFACQSCTAACRMENNTPVAGKNQADMGRAILWNEVLPFVEGEYPEHPDHDPPAPLHALRRTGLREGLPGAGDLQERRRHRAGGLRPLYRLPHVHGGLPVRGALLQLVRPGMAGRPERTFEPRSRSAAATQRRGREMHLLRAAIAQGARRGRSRRARLQRHRLHPGLRDRPAPGAPATSATWMTPTAWCPSWRTVRAPIGCSKNWARILKSIT